MIDLFYPAVPRKRVPSRVHYLDAKRIDPDVATGICNKKKISPRADYYRTWYMENRARQLENMKARYQKKKAEYFERAAKWKAENPEKVQIIKKNWTRKRTQKRILSRYASPLNL